MFKQVVSVFLVIGLLVVFGASPVLADDGDGLSANSPTISTFHPKTKKSFRTIAGGVVERKTVFYGDPRLYVTPGHNLTFRTYVYDNKVLAVTWQNAPRQIDPFSMAESSLQGMVKEMRFWLANAPSYRVVAVFDYDRDYGSSGALYSPRLFPPGFEIKDIKW